MKHKGGRRYGRMTVRLKGLCASIPIGLAAVALLSCAPETGLDTIEDYDVVVTLYDKTVDYGTIGTYLMPDSIVHFQDPENPGRQLGREHDDLILERVEYNLQAIGYTKETDPGDTEPDVYVLVSATSSRWYAAAYSWWPRWGWWPYWPGGSSDWIFMGPYYGGGRTYEFSTGTLLVDIADNRNREEDEEPPGIWTGAINGILEDESSNTAQRLVDMIDRAFHQSPYLGAED